MCSCREKMETAILDHFKKTKPDSKDHKISLKGYGFTLSANKIGSRPYMEISQSAKRELKTQPGVWRKESYPSTVFFNNCPFCGEAIQEN